MPISIPLLRRLRALPVLLGATCLLPMSACGITAGDLAQTRDRAEALEQTLADNVEE